MQQTVIITAFCNENQSQYWLHLALLPSKNKTVPTTENISVLTIIVKYNYNSVTDRVSNSHCRDNRSGRSPPPQLTGNSRLQSVASQPRPGEISQFQPAKSSLFQEKYFHFVCLPWQRGA